MKIYIVTQVIEDGRPKGGDEYFIHLDADDDATQIMSKVYDLINVDGINFKEYIIGWNIVEDCFVSADEENQLEYDGYISYHTMEISKDWFLYKTFTDTLGDNWYSKYKMFDGGVLEAVYYNSPEFIQ